MKKAISLVALVVAFLGGELAFGQGCGQQVVTEFFSCAPCFTHDIATESCFGSGGNPSFYCYEGYGLCCNIQFSTANTIKDEFGCSGPNTAKFRLPAVLPLPNMKSMKFVSGLDCRVDRNALAFATKRPQQEGERLLQAILFWKSWSIQ